MKADPKDVYDYLRKIGIDQVHALGMLANIQGESNFNAGAQEAHPIAGRGGWGLFQHTGPRRRALEAYCKAHGKLIDDWQAQIDYALTEPDTEHYLDKHFHSAEDAVAWFVRHWERPANPERDVQKRVAYLATISMQIA